MAVFPVIPQTVTVHLGPPDAPAEQITLPFPDYIKNVASGELYPTWPENALRANIYAQISFTLNRIYTEFYRSRGYDFDITSDTTIDQTFTRDRDIFENISRLTDELFTSYLRRTGSIEPLPARYCNGTTSTCPGLSQWGTVTLAEQGQTPIDILRYYYGPDVEIVSNTPVQGIPFSPPLSPLTIGSSGDDVLAVQLRLNRISRNYPTITVIPETDGFFGVQTESAVRDFQRIFNLAEDGIVGKSTWYKVINIYNGVKRLSDINSEGISPEEVRRQFDTRLERGSTGVGVGTLQILLNAVAAAVPSVPPVTVDLIYGAQTENAVRAFQALYGLPVTGITERGTWNALLRTYEAILAALPDDSTAFPGIVLTRGMEGDDVLTLQRLINGAAVKNPAIPSVTEDGVFGARTEEAVEAIQRIYGIEPNGRVGAVTWEILLNAQ